VAETESLRAQVGILESELQRYRGWVNDLQSGMFINCVYCGHQYGPREETPVAMADVLKGHIEKCPEHPLSQARSNLAAAMELKKYAQHVNCTRDPNLHWPCDCGLDDLLKKLADDYQ
jgi:hypothetical protein